ncbi:MAG: LD-carboxypeptidase [Myxococcaceae bacterium]
MKILPLAISSPFKTDAYEAGKKILESRGYELIREPVLRTVLQSYLNGSDSERLEELQEAFCSKADLIWAVRGGYGITRLLFDFSCQSPTPLLLGFSDTTALMLHLWANFKHKSLHAPTIARLSQEPAEVLEALDLILKGQAVQVRYPEFDAWSSNAFTGILIPVNLCMLTELIGTSSMPDFTDCILILEEIAEEDYQIDRMLTHLYAAGILKNVKAIIVGHLTECGTGSLEVFKERCEAFKIPCFTGFKMGHEAPNWPVPVGVIGEISVEGQKASLKILEEL